MNTLLIFLILLLGHPELVKPDTTFIGQNSQHDLESSKDSVSSVDLESTKYKHRNIISGTGIPMEAGQFEWKNTYIFFNQINIGVTDRLSASASLMFIPYLFVSGFELGYSIGASYAVWQKENIYYLKVSGFVGKIPIYEFSETGFYGLFASNTVGNPRNNFTVGIGYGNGFKTNENSIDAGGFMLTSIAGNLWISEKFSLVTDFLIDPKGGDVAGIVAARAKLKNFYIEAGGLISEGPMIYFGFGFNVLKK
jgi:hypothetical protein